MTSSPRAVLRAASASLACVITATCLAACARPPAPTHASSAGVESTTTSDVTILPLASPLDTARAEISDLAWLGDDLILLPQFPARFPGSSPGSLFALSKADLTSAIDHPGGAALVPRAVPFDMAGVDKAVVGFDGFEAIAFDGDRVFLTIEARKGAGTLGYLVRGHVVPGPRITLDPGAIVPIAPPVSIANVGFEALTIDGDSVIAFFEVNGASRVTSPVARRFTRDLVELPPFACAPIDYRITGATTVDAQKRFWVMNYFWPGEPSLARPTDDAATRASSVEQIVELTLRRGSIERTGRAPIRLTPDARKRPRNWEGVTQLGERGFLVVTDEHPATMLGFVPLTDRSSEASGTR